MENKKCFIKFHFGIEFYLFFFLMEVWSDRGSTCKFRNAQSAFRNLHVDPLWLHTSMRNKQVEFNPYIYTLTTLSKLYRFGYEISVFQIQNTRSLFYGHHYSSLHRLVSLHGKLNVKIFLMFIVAENTGSVNITNWFEQWLSIFYDILWMAQFLWFCGGYDPRNLEPSKKWCSAWIMKENAMATSLEPHECVIFAQSTKIGTHKYKAIHSNIQTAKYQLNPQSLHHLLIMK